MIIFIYKENYNAETLIMIINSMDFFCPECLVLFDMVTGNWLLGTHHSLFLHPYLPPYIVSFPFLGRRSTFPSLRAAEGLTMTEHV